MKLSGNIKTDIAKAAFVKCNYGKGLLLQLQLLTNDEYCWKTNFGIKPEIKLSFFFCF